MKNSKTVAVPFVVVLTVGLVEAIPIWGAEVPFTERVVSTAADAAISVFAIDLDGDNDTDILSASQSDNKVAWYENNGGPHPTFTEHVISNTADVASSVFAIDLDDDTDIDVLSASREGDEITWYENDGGTPPAFTKHVISMTADGAHSVYAADVDGDGYTDVLSASAFDDKIAWYENDGNSPPTFTEHVISTTADFALSVFAIDSDGDGDIDVFSASRNDNKIAWYENDGGSPPTFTERIISSSAAQALSVFAADLDGDHDTDVLSASNLDDTIAWYENDGGSPPSFTEHVISLAANNAYSVFASDVNSDGKIDILSSSELDDKIAWYENDGGSPPSFTERVISTAADGARSVFAIDLDSDGDADILSASEHDDKIAWYENTSCPFPAAGTTILVPHDFATIQAAIDASCPGDEIIVAPGSYNEVINFIGKPITLRSSDGADVTIIDGAGLNDSVVKCESGEGFDTALDGFTIRGGTGALDTSFTAQAQAGGILIDNSSPTIRNCTIGWNNTVTPADDGGGMVNYRSSPWVEDCTFIANTTWGYGGGMLNRDDSSPTVIRCKFIHNSSLHFAGGGMANHRNSNPLLVNCLFHANLAVGDVIPDGGAIQNRESSNPTMINCTLSFNVANGHGGGMRDDDDCHPLVTNGIFWGNSDSTGFGTEGQISERFGSAAMVRHSNVQGGWTGAGGGNINADPMFIDPISGNLRLLSTSPCIDEGDNSVITEATDLDGNARIVDGDANGDCVVDMGAYETKFPLCEFQKLLASDGHTGDEYGKSVALSGNTIAIGAPPKDGAAGAAYIYRLIGNSWVEESILSPSVSSPGDSFGIVSLSGHVTVVAASRTDVDAGSIFIFRRNANGTPLDLTDDFWVEEAHITGSVVMPGDRFGAESGVSISDDTIVVGAYRSDHNGSGSGIAFVFRYIGEQWIEEAVLIGADTASGDEFGIAVAAFEDTVVIGAYNDDDNGTSSGSAYVFRRHRNTTPLDPTDDYWYQEAKLHASDAKAGELFGRGVATHHDIIVIGAYAEANGEPGSAYVFRRDDNDTPLDPTDDTWNQDEPKLDAFDAAPGDWFGLSVAVHEKFVLVGASGKDDHGINSGAAYLFKHDGVSWNLATKISASDPDPGDLFGGLCVSIDAETAVVPAYFDNEKGANAGTAYVFSLDCNLDPIADAGGPYFGEPGDGSSQIPLSGGGSSDPEGHGLSYFWTTECPGASFEDENSQNPTLTIDTTSTCNITCAVTLIVSDDLDSDTSTTTVSVIDATLPTITCPLTQTKSNDLGTCGAVVFYSTPTAEDNCSGVTVTQKTGLGPDSFFPVGATSETYQATDEAGNFVECSVAITVEDLELPSISCPANVTLECPANTSEASNGMASGSDNCGDPVFGFSDSSAAGCGDTETIIRTWTATDEAGNETSCDQAIMVQDSTPPTITNLDGSPLLVSVGESVTFELQFSDDCGAPHTADWDFGNGSLIVSTDSTISPTSADHTYLSPGIFTVTAMITDECGNASSSSIVIVVYDPTAGFTTGGGWFVPDAESSIDGVLVTDTESKANFGFVVKYKKGAGDLDGNLEFVYRAGDINLHSTDMEWLVVQSATKVRFKGQAIVNGEGTFTFKVTAEDNGEPGTNDTFQIEIWLGVVDTENGPPMPKHKAKGVLGGGNIKIHE